jgi:hypothetical protein
MLISVYSYTEIIYTGKKIVLINQFQESSLHASRKQLINHQKIYGGIYVQTNQKTLDH